MLSSLANLARFGMGLHKREVQRGSKVLKYFIDSVFREKAVPVPGSVLYCDLWVAVEHSGIYVGEGKISNIVVDGFAECTVRHSPPESFTSKSVLGRKIYVSCNRHGAVGHAAVAHGANAHVGERSFYGLVFKNCHEFSTKCVNYADEADADSSWWENWLAEKSDETWEPTLRNLKGAARSKLGATKWRLWDWANSADLAPPPEPDWDAHGTFFENLALNAESIAQIRSELAATKAYESEIADENIPEPVRQRLGAFRQTLADISQKYDQVSNFLALNKDASFSYAELKACSDDFAALAKMLQANVRIKDLVKKLGRNYISEERKKQVKVPQSSKSEIHGTHRSDDVMRMLPSELLNLEDDTLEVLFYSRLLEQNLLTYELQGVTFTAGEQTESNKQRTGPVVACLDTSGSMQGAPLLKAKALLLAIANMLKQEDRSLHVLLFGEAGELREFSMDEQNNSAGLLKFLQQGFGGGTDFEAPIQRAFDIITLQKDYKKADVLMISDGECSLSPTFVKTLNRQKATLNCTVYTVLCAGVKAKDAFSDEVIVL